MGGNGRRVSGLLGSGAPVHYDAMRIFIVLLLPAAAILFACSSSTTAAKASVLASAKVVAGDSQTGTAGAALPSAIVIQALDSNGHPAVGVNVAYGPSTGSVNPSSNTTDNTGKASTIWTLGTTAGPDTLQMAVQQGTASIVTLNAYATTNP